MKNKPDFPDRPVKALHVTGKDLLLDIASDVRLRLATSYYSREEISRNLDVVDALLTEWAKLATRILDMPEKK